MTARSAVDLDALRSALREAIGRAAAADDLAALAGALAEAQAHVALRIAASAAPSAPPAATEPRALLTVAEACAMARCTPRQLYAWARLPGARWPRRLSARALRVDAAGFERWLASRGGRP